MKLILYHANAMMKEIAENWAKENQIEVTVLSELLTAESVKLAKGYDGIINSQAAGTIDKEIYRTLREYGIRQIALVSAGYELYDLKLATENNLVITNVPSYSPESIAEYTVLTGLNLVRNNNTIIANVAKNDFRWQPSICGRVMGDMKVAIIGTGRIGQITAKLFHGFGCELVGFDLYQNEGIKSILTYKDSIEEAVKDADIVSIHMPATADNRHRFDYEMFQKFKPGSILLNMARGSIVDTEGLLKALDEGILSGAGIDTYEYEMPYIQKDYQDKLIEDEVFARLVHHPRVMYSPHIAYFTDEAIKNLVEGALNAAVEVITTGTSKSRVN